jgi:hypothetical protein
VCRPRGSGVDHSRCGPLEVLEEEVEL